MKKIAHVNKLDMALYNHALQIITTRLKAVGVLIDLSHVDKVIKAIIPDPVGRKTKNVHMSVMHCGFYFLVYELL